MGMRHFKHGKMKFTKENVISSICFGIAVILFFAVGLYSMRDIKYSQHQERVNGLNIVMSKIGSHMNTTFSVRWERLLETRTRIERLQEQPVDDVSMVLNDIYMESQVDYHVIDENGFVHDRNGKQAYWKNHECLLPTAESFLLEESSFSDKGEKMMLYIASLDAPATVGEITIEHVIMSEPISKIKGNFDISNYGENCLSFIVSENGDYVYDNGSADAMAQSKNLLKYIQMNVQFRHGSTFEQLNQGIQNGESDTMLVTYNGANYYLSFCSLAMERWSLILFVPERNMEISSNNYSQRIMGDIAYVFLAAMVLFSVCFVHMWRKTIARQEKAVEAERASNEAKTTFLSCMSHDIRTPLNAIMGLTEISLNRGYSASQMRENMGRIRVASTHLLTLINDILDMSEIETGKMTLNNVTFSVLDAANTLTNMIRPQANVKGVDFRVAVHSIEQEYLLGDELRINQICINLLSNAIKYTEAGGQIKFEVWQEPISDVEDCVRMRFAVQDTGIGMSENFQKIMYDVFARETDSRVNQIGGSGLGLSICQQMVRMMDGTIECHSEVGQGTTFVVTLVLQKDVPNEDYTLPPIKVLAIEEHPDTESNLLRIFEGLGVDSEIVSDISSVIRDNADRHTSEFGLAFVELGAPALSGLQKAKQLRALFGEAFPIIFTSEYDLSEYSQVIHEMGDCYQLNKPFSTPAVYQKLCEVLGHGKDEADEKDAEQSRLNGMRILVAEDNDLNWEILDELLKLNGVTADRAENGLQCIEILENAKPNRYDAIFMDVRMPIMDGREAARRLRQSQKEWIQKIPIVAMTADAFVEDIRACLEAGMNSHLAKPIEINKLTFVLRRIKEKHDLRKDENSACVGSWK